MSKNLLNLLLAVGTFSIYYLVISPLYTGVGSVWQPEQGITTLQSTNTQYDSTLLQVEGLYKQAETLRSQYASLSEESKQKMSVMVPEIIDPVRLVSEVSSIGLVSGVMLRDLDVTELSAVTGSARGGYRVGFTVDTTYTKFKELMHNFETSMRLFSIQGVSFTVSPKDDSIMSFQVKLETYTMK